MKNKWNDILRQDDLIPDPCCDRRPLTCNFNGFRDECNVVFIGLNPKNSLGIDWWDLWDDNTGFNYDHFISVYPSSTSKTRRFYQEIKDLGCKSVETNVFSHPHNTSPIPNQQVLCALLDNLPRNRRIGLIPHGMEAKNFISTYSVPNEWRVIGSLQLGWASKAEKGNVKRFCLDITRAVEVIPK